MKWCFRCGAWKKLNQFYVHRRMADGHLNKCKECTKRDVKLRRFLYPEKLKEYEVKRNKKPGRIEKRCGYLRRYRARHPEKDLARSMVFDAVRSGRLAKLPCSECGSEKVEAHHRDYSKPLDVQWLCHLHHRQAEGRVVKP